MNRDRLLEHLDAIGLPHAESLGALRMRLGVTTSRYYDGNVLRIDTAPFVDGQCDAFEPNVLAVPAPDLLPRPRSRASWPSRTMRAARAGTRSRWLRDRSRLRGRAVEHTRTADTQPLPRSLARMLGVPLEVADVLDD